MIRIKNVAVILLVTMGAKNGWITTEKLLLKKNHYYLRDKYALN